MKKPVTKHQQQRQFWLVLPLLVLPFLTLCFWALGGGQHAAAARSDAQGAAGLSLQLPEPRLQEPPGQSKLSLYQEAQREAQRPGPQALADFLQASGLGDPIPPSGASGPDPGQPEEQEARVTQRLAALTALLQPPAPLTPSLPAPASQANRPTAPLAGPDHLSQDVARLEGLLQAMDRNPPVDPAMQQLEVLLERVLDIQHPERVRTRSVPEPVASQAPLAPQGLTEQATVTILNPAPAAMDGLHASQAGGFHGLPPSTDASATGAARGTITAAIHETQTVVTGGIVKMRLLQDAVLGGRRLPKGSLVYGTCRLQGERLLIQVKGLQAQQVLLPVALSAYDLDGHEGLYTPGSITREAARQGADRAIGQSLQLTPLSPSLGAQAANAGISAAQGLLGRKTRQVKITLKAGYQLLLRDQQDRS